MWYIIGFIVLILLFVVIWGLYAYVNRSQTPSKNMLVNRDKLRSTFKQLYPLLSNGLQVWPTYGTLLGFHREQDFICYDDDIDLGANIEDFTAIKHNVFKLDKHRYKKMILDAFGYKFISIDDLETGVHVDVNFYKPKNSHQVCCANLQPNKTHEIGHIYPVSKGFYIGEMQIWMPNDADQLLRCWYGNNYTTPDRICDNNCVCED